MSLGDGTLTLSFGNSQPEKEERTPPRLHVCG